ncbi:hypothetical protein HY477_00050 [Candidatus Uhrbacteria bacterium]|nr:hypothetical protein [Candidatus Uhrbacteria bacterium]
MPPKFLKQETGLLIVPESVPKYHVSWNIDNVISGFKKFFADNKRWPVAADMRLCPYLPNVKTLERKFGGIRNVRHIMGIDVVDFSSGESRSKIAKTIGARGFQAEEQMYELLVKRFHEPFVHGQARVVVNSTSLNVDFLVYHKAGKFAVDILYPDSDPYRISNNLHMKYKTYKHFPYLLFLVVANTDIKEDVITKWLTSEKRTNFNDMLITLTYGTFLKRMEDFQPFIDPYKLGKLGGA